jgi:hypothetical protein
VEAYRQRIEQYSDSFSYIQGWPMGYKAGRFLVESPQDALVVLLDTVSVIDGVVRGLAQNRSERLWAHDAAVTATDPTGVEHTWRFPFAVQPYEPMPFEIEGWTGSQYPSKIALTVSADMSSRIDLTRSLNLVQDELYLPAETLSELYPEAMVGREIPDGWHAFRYTKISRASSAAHPRLKLAALQQTIENLAVYAAIFTDGLLLDVFELTPVVKLYHDEDPGSRWIEVSGIGVELPELPDLGPIDHPMVGVLLNDGETVNIWAGGADA